MPTSTTWQQMASGGIIGSNSEVNSYTLDNTKPLAYIPDVYTPKFAATIPHKKNTPTTTTTTLTDKNPNKLGLNGNTSEAVGMGVNAATGIFSAMKAYNQQKANAAGSIAAAKSKHSLNAKKFGVNRQDAYIDYLATKGKMDQTKYNTAISFQNNNAKIDTGVNQTRQQMTASTQAINQQLLHGYHRLSALDLSNIQGKLGQSQMQLENAQSQAKLQKEQNSFANDMAQKTEDVQDDQMRLSARKSQLKINLSQSEETDKYNDQIAEIKYQMAAAKKARNSAIASGVGKLAGMAVGGAIGGPIGAQMGGAIGGGVGGAAAGW